MRTTIRTLLAISAWLVVTYLVLLALGLGGVLHAGIIVAVAVAVAVGEFFVLRRLRRTPAPAR